MAAGATAGVADPAGTERPDDTSLGNTAVSSAAIAGVVCMAPVAEGAAAATG
jgi:hypothetical protein